MVLERFYGHKSSPGVRRSKEQGSLEHGCTGGRREAEAVECSSSTCIFITVPFFISVVVKGINVKRDIDGVGGGLVDVKGVSGWR